MKASICSAAILLLAFGVTAQNLYVASGNNILEFAPNGTQSTFAASGVNVPRGLAFDSAGDLFEADWWNGNIYEFTPGGVQSTFASGLNHPTGLAFDSAGNLFEADAGSGNIYEFTPGGGQSAFASGLSGPQALAINSAGNLFVGDGNNIYQYTSGGVQSVFASGVNVPRGLAFDSAGNLFVGEGGPSSSTIVEITPGGAQSPFAAYSAFDLYAIAFDNAGNLFSVNVPTPVNYGYNGIIYKFTPGGVRSTFAYPLDSPEGLAFQPVPEPSILGLLALSAPALIVRRLHRRAIFA